MPRQARLDIPGALHHIMHDWKKKGEYNRVDKDTWDITSPQHNCGTFICSFPILAEWRRPSLDDHLVELWSWITLE